MKRLETLLTRIPMYTLVAGGLGFLIVCAGILSLTGAVSFSLLSLIVSSLVFASVSAASSYGFGQLYGAPSHIRSSLITALILTLLFTPSLEVWTLASYGFIALIAQASKYVLTFRRRHVFNPAAIAAMISGTVLHLQFASWWVATPVLFVPVAIAAFLVLYKTRQLALGGTFLAISGAIVAGTNMLRGETILSSILVALTSWPLIFVAGFMLSEPLTLPPRHWQRLVVASVAAIVIAVPFHIGSLYSSPELALVLANLCAFGLAFSQRRQIALTFKEKRALTPTSYELVFTANHSLPFTPGQYIELTLPHARQDIRGTRRTFSLTSVPGSQQVSLGVKFYQPSSSFKQALATLAPGTVVATTGINGDFVLPAAKHDKLLFIAGGIGITPFISFIRSQATTGRTITLLYFMRHPEEAAYRDELERSGIEVVYCVAEGAGGLFLDAPQITSDLLTTWVRHIGSRTAYVSGPPAFVAASNKLLRGRVRQVRTDYFSGY